MIHDLALLHYKFVLENLINILGANSFSKLLSEIDFRPVIDKQNS